jgi:type I restriction enzyme R subunit
MLNEADTRAKLIDPKLKEAGWTEEIVSREYPISVGRIEVIGETTRRAAPKKADYILRLNQHGEALAVVEAKEEGVSATKGVAQAKEYAKSLRLLFAYSTNGHEIEEFNFLTNKQTTVKEFPSPEELKKQYVTAILRDAIDKTKGEKILNEPYYFAPTFSLRYYQEATVHSAIQQITEGKKRLLLTLATGTGKTVIAFNLVWKLLKSGYFKRVLFIADRNFLRNQAYNTFEPFGDARVIIEEGKTPRHQNVYFSIYQALYGPTPSGKRIFEEYPSDFFDLIIIDECHRSGFGTWNDILKHFSGAVHLGMTATPKRTDNVDSYKYFGEPVYVYSYGQGVQDGYLAPFIVHRILTNIDKDGQLSIEEAKSKGAEIIVPVEEEAQDVYSQKEFERKITLPDRTHEIAKHLAKLLKTFDPMAKTMVFCVDSDHADLMAKELQNEFSDLGFDNYAVSIIARNGDIQEAEYERFKDSEKPNPVVATTVDLLTTGIDVPSVRNVVIVKPISSKIVFKQIIGRGCRIDAVTGKNFFRIIDYIGATRLFDDWEKVPEPTSEEEPEGDENYFVSGMVVDEELQDPIAGATITLQRKVNEQLYERTDREGLFLFSQLPSKKYSLSVRATDFKSRTVSLDAVDNPKETALIELARAGKKPKKVIVKGLPVHIAEEDRLVLEKEGKTLTVEEYIKYAGSKVVQKIAHAQDLRNLWVDPEKRRNFLEDLTQESIYPEVLAELLQRPDLDGFDLLSQVAYGTIPLSRDERAESLLNKEQRFLTAFSNDAREIIYALIEKYRLVGIEEIENPLVFELPPFDKMGRIEGVQKQFGDIDKLKTAIAGLRNRFYPSSYVQ